MIYTDCNDEHYTLWGTLPRSPLERASYALIVLCLSAQIASTQSGTAADLITTFAVTAILLWFGCVIGNWVLCAVLVYAIREIGPKHTAAALFGAASFYIGYMYSGVSGRLWDWQHWVEWIAYGSASLVLYGQCRRWVRGVREYRAARRE